MPHHFHPKEIQLHPKVAPLVLANPAYLRALNQFIAAPLPGSNEEKLHTSFNTPSFTIRFNGIVRFFIVPDPQDESIGLLIRVMDDHDYDKINRKPNSWLAQQIKKTKEIIIRLPELEEKTELASALPQFKIAKNIEFCNQHYIVFSEHQEAAKKKALPLILSGAPGSGKSTLLLSILKDLVLRDSHKKYLVIAESEDLVAFLKTEWEALCEVESLPESLVDFKTPNQLHGIIKKLDHSGLDVFKFWFKGYLSELKEQGLISEGIKSILAEQDFIYAEFASMSGYDSFEAYNTAVPSSFYSCLRLRLIVWDLLKKYLFFLEENPQHIDFSFEPIPNLGSYEICLVDEALDLSRAQLKSFGPNTLFCIGDHQQLFGSESIIPFINSHWKEQGITVAHCPLLASFRCGKHLVDFANFLLELKYFCIGGKKMRASHTFDFVESAKGMEEGRVIWIENEQELQPLIADKENADFAVVTHPAHLLEAQKLFGEERVFTPQSIKGLQYKTLLIYRIEYDELKTLEEAMREYRPEANSASSPNLRQGFLFNGPFVCATRGQENLYVYFPDKKKCHNLREQLKQFILKFEENRQPTEYKKTVSSTAQWSELQQNLQRRGKEQQAAAIQSKCKPLIERNLVPEAKKTPPEPIPVGTKPLVFHVKATTENLLSSKGIEYFSNKYQPNQALIDYLVLNHTLHLKKALATAVEQIISGKATQEQSDYFIGLTNYFKKTLKELLHPHNEFILKKKAEITTQLKKGNPLAIDSFYRIFQLTSATVQRKLEVAIREGFLVMIKSLCQPPIDLNRFNFLSSQGIFPIISFAFLECKRQTMKVIETLLVLGADINALSSENPCLGTVLYLAYLGLGDKTDHVLINQLLDWKANPWIGIPNAILAAAIDDNLPLLQLFHQRKIDLGEENSLILLYVVIQRRKKILEFLLESTNLYFLYFYNTGEEWLSLLNNLGCSTSRMEEFLGTNLKTQVGINPCILAQILGFRDLVTIFSNYKAQLIAKAERYDPKAIKTILLHGAVLDYLDHKIKTLRLMEHLLLNKPLLTQVLEELSIKERDKKIIENLISNLESKTKFRALAQFIKDFKNKQKVEEPPINPSELKQTSTLLINREEQKLPQRLLQGTTTAAFFPSPATTPTTELIIHHVQDPAPTSISPGSS